MSELATTIHFPGESAAAVSNAYGVDSTPQFDPFDLRGAFGEFPQGVVAVGSEVDGSPEAVIASTFTVGVSLEPPLVTFAIQHTSSTWPRIRDAGGYLGVSVIGRDQYGLCGQIASKDRANRFNGVAYTADIEGALTIGGAPLWLKTRIYSQFPAGDHEIIVLEVMDFGAADEAEAMVFHRSEFKELSTLGQLA